MSSFLEHKCIKWNKTTYQAEQNDIIYAASTVNFRFSTINTVIKVLAAYQIIYKNVQLSVFIGIPK